jgi:hypothetical protein
MSQLMQLKNNNAIKWVLVNKLWLIIKLKRLKLNKLLKHLTTLLEWLKIANFNNS